MKTDNILESQEEFVMAGDLQEWVMAHVDDWRDHYSSKYQDKHEEYYRIWRGIYSEDDKVRQSERSKIIPPALQQAVESSVSELEEATFGRGKWFDLEDDDPDNMDTMGIREQLHVDFKAARVRTAMAESMLNAAVTGTGVAEVVVENFKSQKPATRPNPELGMDAYGVEITDRTLVRLRPVMEKNFLHDPYGTCVEDCMGLAFDEMVSYHIVQELQEAGVYRDESVAQASPDTDVEPDSFSADNDADVVRLIRYFGKVPRDLLREYDKDVEAEGSYYVEALVVIANDETLLKAVENPFMMKDRPVLTFAWDTVPGRLRGRGVVEKGYNAYKALEAEMRARIDALALTVHPMIGVDSTKLPRGFKPTVAPGKMWFTTGNPRESFAPVDLGGVDQVTFAQAGALQQMIQEATGAVDSTGLLSNMDNAKTGAVSMSLGAVIKRHKRTLINFQENFLIPFVEKAAWRYMQYEPELYPSKDYSFRPVSTLGIIAREYEVSQLVTLLNTMSPDSPLYSPLVQSVIENMNLSNREELVATLQKAMEPTPEAQQAQKDAKDLQDRRAVAEIDFFNAQAADKKASAELSRVKAQEEPKQTQYDMLRAITNDLKDQEEDKSFEKRLQILDRMLKEKEVNVKDKEATARIADKRSQEVEERLMKRMGA